MEWDPRGQTDIFSEESVVDLDDEEFKGVFGWVPPLAIQLFIGKEWHGGGAPDEREAAGGARLRRTTTFRRRTDSTSSPIPILAR